MITFKSLKEKLDRVPSGTKIFSKKIKGIPVSLYKYTSGFVVYIDGDRLESYKTQREAERMATEFIKQYQG